MALRTFKTDVEMPYSYESSIPVTSTGDIYTISGRENVMGAVRRRLLTSTGAMTYRLAYGANVLDVVGQNMTESVLELLGTQIQENLGRDTRLEDASLDIGLSDDHKNLVIKLDLKLLGDTDRSIINLQVGL